MPVTPQQLYQQSCSNDDVTIDSWRATWIKNVRDNYEKYGPFAKQGIGQLFENLKHRPCIVVGSGPSLRYNAGDLVERAGIPVISCLHNFHYLEDLKAPADFYVTLDAGEVTIEEVYEGGRQTPEEYWALTKDRTLLAFIGTSPRLLEKWQGKVYWFNSPVPDQGYQDAIKDLEPFHTYVSTGGNVLGASLYIARAIMGANPICFMGADFSHSYMKKFHAWDSKYDANLGYTIRLTDVYGNRVHSWQTYANFKGWFEAFACSVPGFYVNSTEGGCLGSYPDGNIRQITQMTLKDFIKMYRIHEHKKEQCLNPATQERKLLF
jgi:hypothetical protein